SLREQDLRGTRPAPRMTPVRLFVQISLGYFRRVPVEVIGDCLPEVIGTIVSTMLNNLRNRNLKILGGDIVELLRLGFVETDQIVNNTRLCGFWNFEEILACPISRILGLDRCGHRKDSQSRCPYNG